MAWIELPQESRHSLIRTALLTRPPPSRISSSSSAENARSIPNVLVPSGRLHGEDNGAGRRQAYSDRFGWNASRPLRAGGSQVPGIDVYSSEQRNLCYETWRAPWENRSLVIQGATPGRLVGGIFWAVGNVYSRCRLDKPTIAAQVMDYLGEENRTRSCPSGRRICSTKYTHRWPTALCVGYCGQGFLSTDRQREVLRNEGNRRTPLLQFKNTPIRTATSAFLNAYLFRGLFLPRARGTRVESPGGIAVEGST
jgi:hypothetical protein